MAKFNENVYNAEFATKDEIKQCVLYLQECLSQEEYQQLHDDYHTSDKDVPFWQYAFDRIQVSYSKENQVVSTAMIDRMAELKKGLPEMPIENIEDTLKKLSVDEVRILLKLYVYEGR